MLKIACSIICPIVLSAVSASEPGIAADCAANRLLPVDPVALLAGAELPGKPELTIERNGYTYQFATPENKARFEAHSIPFEVADGGACGSMGPLSGKGDARRYLVHDGRIYLFASDGCLATFIKDPARCVEHADPVPTGSEKAIKEGNAIVDRFVGWAGGPRAIQGMRAYRQRLETRTGEGEDEVVQSHTITIQFERERRIEYPGERAPRLNVPFGVKLLDRSTWRDATRDLWWGVLMTPDGAASISPTGREELVPSQREAVERQLLRLPIMILRARFEPGFVAVADGRGVLREGPVDFLLVHFRGVTSRLAIHRESGKLLQIAFRGRERSSRIGDIVRSYTGFTTQRGFTLPTGWTTTFDGEDDAKLAGRFLRVDINPILPDDAFEISPATPAEPPAS